MLTSYQFETEEIEGSPPFPLKPTLSEPVPSMYNNAHQNYIRRRQDFVDRGVSPLAKAVSEPYLKKTFFKTSSNNAKALEDIVEASSSSVVADADSSAMDSYCDDEEDVTYSRNDTLGSDHVFDDEFKSHFGKQMQSTPDACGITMTNVRARTPLNMSVIQQAKNADGVVDSGEMELGQCSTSDGYYGGTPVNRFLSTVHSTPNSKNGTPNEYCIANPFESFLSDRLHANTYSPSIFARVVSPSEESTVSGNFQWSIDHVALMNPVDIRVRHAHQVSSIKTDDETEARYQALVDRYFAESVIAPSPWSDETKPIAGMFCSYNHASPSSCSNGKVIRKTDPSPNIRHHNVSCQTLLTLPPNLDIFKLFGGPFLYRENIEETTSGNETNTSVGSGLRRKLFPSDEDGLEASSVDVEIIEGKIKNVRCLETVTRSVNDEIAES